MIYFSDDIGTVIKNNELMAKNKKLEAEVQSLKTAVEVLKKENHNLLGASSNPEDRSKIRMLNLQCESLELRNRYLTGANETLMRLNREPQWKLDTCDVYVPRHLQGSSSGVGSFISALACVTLGFYLGSILL